jgi:hypothetical protein
MSKANTARYPITLSRLADAVASGMSFFSRIDAARPQSMHITRRQRCWTVIVKLGAFESCKNVADHYQAADFGGGVEQWMEGEVSMPLAAALAEYFHSASRGG